MVKAQPEQQAPPVQRLHRAPLERVAAVRLLDDGLGRLKARAAALLLEGEAQPPDLLDQEQHLVGGAVRDLRRDADVVEATPAAHAGA